MFADNFMLRSESGKAVQTNLEKWRNTFKKRGMKLRSKTQYMAVNEMINVQLNLPGVRIQEIEEIKNL